LVLTRVGVKLGEAPGVLYSLRCVEITKVADWEMKHMRVAYQFADESMTRTAKVCE
jgi:hypothetical protein